MSYLSDFYFDDDKKIILPLDFFNGIPSENSPEIKLLLEEQKELSSLSEDVMTVKQSKRLEELFKLLYCKDVNEKHFHIEPYKNKYGFNCMETTSHTMAGNFIEEDRNLNFALICSNGNEIVKTLTDDSEVIFLKNDNGYVLKSLNGSLSNNSWVEEKFLDLIFNLKLSVTVKDAGNEEIGFLFRDGVDDEKELEPDRIYIDGFLQK